MRYGVQFACVAAIAVGVLAAEAAQPVSERLPAPAPYAGPPAMIDGPTSVSPPAGGWLDSTGQAVILPDGTSAEPLTLPGGSITDTLPPDEMPPDQLLLAPPQK